MKTSPAASPSNFSIEIESLRGIAAFLVLFGHIYILTNLPVFLPKIPYLAHRLMASIFDPQPPVLLFFTISGLVLGRQLQKDSIEGFPFFIAYLCRRAFRLIPLMWVSTCFAFSLNYYFNNSNFSVLYSTLLLQNVELNVPLWSLQVELWCSLFFPLLFWMFRTSGIIYNVVLFIGFIVLSYFGHSPIFMQFWVFFHAGLLIDRYGTYLNHPQLKNPWVIIVAYLIFILAPEFSIGPRNFAYGYWQSWVLPEILACVLIVFFVVHNKNPVLNSFLRLSWIRYLGKISFSIYLLHLPLLLIMITKYPASSRLQLVVHASCYLLLTLLLSSLTYHWIELPFNRLGKKLYSAILTTKMQDKIAEGLPEI